MKVSVSLPSEDLAFLDLYVKDQGLESRSAALQKAVRLLRVAELDAAYASAWDEWESSGAAADWNAAASDGLSGSPRSDRDAVGAPE